jgi:hypothetical protein
VDTGNLKYLRTGNSSTSAPADASFTQTFTNGGTITKSDGNGSFYLWILAKDTAGNTTKIRSNPFNIDNTAPTCTNTGDSTTWTKGDRTITYGCNDANECNSSYQGGSQTFSTTTKTATITTYEIRDIAGNSTTCPARTANVYVDNTAPICGTRTYSPALTVPTNGTVTATLSGSRDLDS